MENEEPCLSLCFQAPGGGRRQIDLFEHEMCIRHQKRPRVGELGWCGPEIGRPGIRHRNCALDVKLTLPIIIEKTEGRVAALLDLRDYDSRTDRMDRPGWHKDNVVRRHGLPPNDIQDCAGIDGLA